MIASNGRKLYSLFLSIGLFFTFLTSITVVVWHEEISHGHHGHADGANQPLLRPQKAAQPSVLLEEWPPVLSAYTEPLSSTDVWYEDPSADRLMPKIPLPKRTLTSQNLTRIMFPTMSYPSMDATSKICSNVPSLLPIDEFGSSIMDPYLPWIHDLFISHDGTNVHIIAQNKRRCHKGKLHTSEMKFWEGQVALFQPVAIKRLNATTNTRAARYGNSGGVRYHLSTHEEADPDGVETRFICRFKSVDYTQQTVTYQGEALSTYPFNYEFVNWRKKKSTMVEDNKEQSYFWLSSLLINCPIPIHLQSAPPLTLMLDIIPIRTPVRRNDRDGLFFHEGHGGPMTFDAAKMWQRNHVLPDAASSGRWENLPICALKKPQLQSALSNSPQLVIPAQKPYRLVACTWTSAQHQRRGNERRIYDGKSRLREWIAFNLQVGFDHVYVFDNTGANSTIFRLKNEVDNDNRARNGDFEDSIDSGLSSVTDLFPTSQVTRIDWPATVCNNNRPAHDDPGERSSQYAAEAACRTRYGAHTDWMASMDPDEYFVPMGKYTNWKEILDKIDREEGLKILKFRSTRARPLLELLTPTYDEGAKECTRDMAREHNQCLTKRDDKTYLETYNCEYIKTPKPERFARAMKQLYRPDYVISHFVHYSTVTTDLATEKQHTKGKFHQQITANNKIERFVDESNEGILIHAKTTVPAETFSREELCALNSPNPCLVGIPCPDDLPFNDELHQKNVFHDEKGEYCNCWMNRKVERYWVPKLMDAMDKLSGG
ncbi:hypothetical protein ACHAXH_009608 [Discostella pseudostelligera]